MQWVSLSQTSKRQDYSKIPNGIALFTRKTEVDGYYRVSLMEKCRFPFHELAATVYVHCSITFAVALLNLAGIRQCSTLSLFASIFVCAVCALILDHDIIIPDKEECWQHWTCSYSLCGDILKSSRRIVANSTLKSSARLSQLL